MSQPPTDTKGSGRSDAVSPAPQYYDLSAPLTQPVTTLQVTGFTLREGMLPSLVAPDGSFYFGPVTEDGCYRIPNGCGIIFFHYDESAPPTFLCASTTSADSSSGGLISYFFSRGVPHDPSTSSGSNGQKVSGQAAAAFTALCKRYQQGDRYGGDWKNGVFHGEGVLVTSHFTYQGSWKDGFMHGKGAITYTRKYVDARPAASGGASGGGVGMGTLLLKGLSYVTPFELVGSAAAPKEYFGMFHAEHGRHGAGLMSYYNGDIYEGEWQDNCRHGKGKLRKLDGEIYEGDWVGDERQGYGKILYPNGSLFKGLMQHDQRNGEGVMRFANGDEYFGNFVANQIEGHGTMKYRNGDIYDGDWHDQLRHGKGKFTLKRTGATMTGTFQNGLIHGEGTVVVPKVSIFVGIFVRGERTVGTMHWNQPTQQESDGKEVSDIDAAAASVSVAASVSPLSANVPMAVASPSSVSSTAGAPAPAPASLGKSAAAAAARMNYLCYQGEWHGDHMHGRGLLWYTNGDFFAGHFQKSLRHGPGNMRYAAEQAEFSGRFIHGVRHGVGLLQRADGSIRAGRWQQNSFVEGYEGEWDGTAFHGIGRLTIPLDRFFGLRASNSTLKLADVSAILNDTATSQPPPPPPPSNTTAAAEVQGVSSPGGATPGASTTAATAVSAALHRADISPHFIDFIGLFRNGVRDGLGLLKLPALDCLVGGTLSSVDDRRSTGKTFAPNKSKSNSSGSSSSLPTPPTSSAAGAAVAASGAGNVSRGKFPSTSRSGSGDAAASVPSVIVKGRWVREVLHCDKGVLAFPNGVVYIGGFRNGARESEKARVWWPDGSVLESGWRDDAPSGPGVWYRRNRSDPIFQTIIPSELRRSRSRCVTDTQTPTAAAAAGGGGAGSNSQLSKADNNSVAGDIFSLSYLWNLVGLGFGGGDGSEGERVEKEERSHEAEQNKPRRVLVNFHEHYAMSCGWSPFPMDLSTYASVVLPEIAAQTAPLPNNTPWPLMLHSASMAVALADTTAWASAASSSAFDHYNSHLNTTDFAAAQQQQLNPPTARQLAAGAAALHLSEPPPKISVGRANGSGVVYFESGVVLAAEWLSNVPRLAVPYRPWSAYDSFLVWQASRPAARNCMNAFPLWVAPRSQSCYSALLAAAPDDVRGEPKRNIFGAPPYVASMAFSPLATGAGGTGVGTGEGSGAAASETVSGVTSPDTRCTVCAKEYSFFRKRAHCMLCLRSTCSSCLGQMDTDGQRQDVKALVQHAYAASESTVQLATALAKTGTTDNSNNNSHSNGGASRRVVFPSITVEQVEHAFDAKSSSTVPVCADCVRALLWKLRYTQLWIPTSMFASMIDVDHHQRDLQMRRKASTDAADAQKKKTMDNTASPAEDEAALVTDKEVASPLELGKECDTESTRQVSAGSELLLPGSQVDSEIPAAAAEEEAEKATATTKAAAAGEGGEPLTPTARGTRRSSDAPTAGSPAPRTPPTPPPPACEETDLSAAMAGSVKAASPLAGSAGNRYVCTPRDPPRPSCELLPPAQYITYSGYTSHSIPHVYGELWWGRRYYYRGGFCAGERHGFGVQYMPNGERYEGAFQRDAWHGQGVYYQEDGSVLLGEFRRGELHDVQYHGEVEEDTVVGVRPHGRGIGYDPDGSLYNGEWAHGQRHGTGMLHLPDGVSIYTGTFVANAMEGMGKMVTTSGAYYGDFSQNRQHGKGLLFTSNCVVEGSWVNGASSGFTRIYETDTGEVYETTYRDGNERDDCFSAPFMVEDADAVECGQCGTAFSFFLRRHHCRLCGDVFCDPCTQHRATLPANFAGDGDTGAGAEGLNATINTSTVGQRVCDACFYRLTQRRMIGLRRYKDGSIYAGCWSQGRWVSRGLYCRPDGIYIVMDTHGHPLISADLARAKMTYGNAEKGNNNSSSNNNDNASKLAEGAAKKTSTPVPPGGLGVSHRTARVMLPISPSILQDAAPAKDVLDNASVIQESSSRKDLDAFLLWWATTRSRCGLQVPLDVPLVAKYQRMPAQLLRGGKTATVSIGSDAATYLACPARCTLATPSTPLLAPIRLFVTLADSRRAMQAMVDGEVKEAVSIQRAADTPPTPAGDAAEAQESTVRLVENTPVPAATTTTATHASAGPPSSSPTLPGTSTPVATTPWLTTEERRTIDSDVEAAALRASRFMPVAIPRAPVVPITSATVPTTSMATLDLDRAADQQPLPSVGFAGTTRGAAAATATEADGGAFGLTAWAKVTPPSIDEADVNDETLMSMMRAERLAWTSGAANSTTTAAAASSSSPSAAVDPLMPPTPAPPALGKNTAIAWNLWTTRDVPRYAPPPLVPVMPEDDSSNDCRKGDSTAANNTTTTPVPQQPRSEADLYFACPFWEPTVPDAQMLLEQGKMTQAARLMRRLQQNQRSDSGGAGEDARTTPDDDDVEDAWGKTNTKPSSSPGSPAGAKVREAGSLDTLDVLQQMQAASGAGTGGSWTAGGLLSAEQRAQSGGGWAPAPMRGPFVFDISLSEKTRSADGQRWYFKVKQREISSFL
ncbi:MORN repeat/FYVE zinc finger containing protein [Lotmaria passim]